MSYGRHQLFRQTKAEGSSILKIRKVNDDAGVVKLARGAGPQSSSGIEMGARAAVNDLAKVAELADAADSKSAGPLGRGGSIPPFGTILLS
jgi:hypothetical protein